MSENQRDPQYKLRWSEELREKVAQSAKEHNRSMNADIVARLEESFNSKSIDESDMYSAFIGFCAGLHFRYQDQLSELQAELTKETDQSRIKALESEIQRIEILSAEMKAISERIGQKS